MVAEEEEGREEGPGCMCDWKEGEGTATEEDGKEEEEEEEGEEEEEEEEGEREVRCEKVEVVKDLSRPARPEDSLGLGKELCNDDNIIFYAGRKQTLVYFTKIGIKIIKVCTQSKEYICALNIRAYYSKLNTLMSLLLAGTHF